MDASVPASQRTSGTRYVDDVSSVDSQTSNACGGGASSWSERWYAPTEIAAASAARLPPATNAPARNASAARAWNGGRGASGSTYSKVLPRTHDLQVSSSSPVSRLP